jgi:hypothetical protein
VQSRAPEYSGSNELPPVKDAQTLAAVAGEPVPSASSAAPTGPSAAPTGPSAAPVAAPQLPGTPELAKDGSYTLTGRDIELVVDPRSGGIERLSLDGKSALFAAEPNVDGGALKAELEGSSLLLRSANGNASKRFRLDPPRRSVEITLTARNASANLGHMSIPDFHRVPSAGGLTFFPGKQLTLPLNAHPLLGDVSARPLSLDVRQSMVWFPHDQNKTTSLGEAYCDASEGWIATVNDGLLLVKAFDESTSRVVIEAAYDSVAKRHTFIEISEQAQMLDVPAGATITRTVRFFLRKLPPDIAPKPGNQELVGFVRGVIQ